MSPKVAKAARDAYEADVKRRSKWLLGALAREYRYQPAQFATRMVVSSSLKKEIDYHYFGGPAPWAGPWSAPEC